MNNLKCFGAFCLAAGAFGQSYIPIVPPRIPQSIFAEAINTGGAVAGYYLDTGAGPTHGFLRESSGAITSFDAPIAFGNPAVGTTYAYSINDNGAIAGSFVQVTGPTNPQTMMGYLRDPFGNFITFAPSGSINTQALSLNVHGFITGWYNEPNLVIHGFIREDSGHIITFDPPDSILTKPVAINDAGLVAGYYQTADGGIHGFLRLRNGAFITFDPPGGTGTTVTDIDGSGDITGFFTLPSGRTFGFIRRFGGEIIPFDSPGVGTFPAHISNAGAVAGWYGGNDGFSGFVRSPEGTFSPLQPPDNCSGNPSGLAVFPTSINPSGLIAGWCITGSPGLLARAAWVRLP